MEAIPKDVIECAILDGQLPQCREGREWCEAHASCYRCAKDIYDMMVEEIRRLKAERDRALAELDKALGEREEERGCIHYDPKRHYCNVHDCDTDDYKRGYDEGFASADDWLAQHEDAMAANGWVRLPVDADGVTIHVGERVQLIGNDPSTVSHMSLADDGWRVYVKYDGGIGTGSGEPKLIHHHAPTVEDVLWEMYEKLDEVTALYVGEVIDSGERDGEYERIITEYAAKLQLRGDAE